MPEWVRATYPTDLTPFELSTPAEYSYAIDPHTYALALAIKNRLDGQGAQINNIAERIFVELPAVHRGARRAERNDIIVASGVTSEALEKRMTWVG